MSSFTATDLINAKIATINEFMALMIERFDINDEINELAEEFKGKLEDDIPLVSLKSKKPKETNEGEKKARKPRTKKADVNSDEEAKVVKKRGPSMYNIFVKEHMHMFNTYDSKTRMAEIGKFWKTSKKGRFFADKQKEIKVSNSELTSQEIYNMICDEWVASEVSDEDQETTEVSDEDQETTEVVL
jgi:hypothetical protein